MFALHGLRVPDHSVITAPIRACIQDGNYERAEAEAILPLLGPNDLVLDLGGGIGVTAALCAKRLGEGRVVVVEADPDLAAPLRATFAANDVDPLVIYGAVSASGQPRRLERTEHFWGTKTRPLRDRGELGERVQGVSLAALLDTYRPTVLLIDIEGGEAGLAPTELHGVRAVVVECHGKAARKAVEAWLSPQGFTRSPGPDPRRTRVRIYERPIQAERKSNAEHV